VVKHGAFNWANVRALAPARDGKENGS
jgi:hypothetical protein